jgi:hypothetical protein
MPQQTHQTADSKIEEAHQHTTSIGKELTARAKRESAGILQQADRAPQTFHPQRIEAANRTRRAEPTTWMKKHRSTIA